MVVASHHIGDLEHLATYGRSGRRSTTSATSTASSPRSWRTTCTPSTSRPSSPPTSTCRWSACSTTTPTWPRAWSSTAAPTPVVALAFDGIGYGPDGTLWGGEVLVADLARLRAGRRTCRPMPMPGGVAAIREPWRMAAVWAGGRRRSAASTPPPLRRRARPRRARVAAPLTTSVGRLFDAVAALVGGRRRVTYEGQAAIELEALARTRRPRDAPAYDGRGRRSTGGVLDPTGLVRRRWSRPVTPASRRRCWPPASTRRSGRAAAALAAEVAGDRGIDTVALTGGVFQNVRLTEVVESCLAAAGLAVLAARRRCPPTTAASASARPPWPRRG